MNETRILLMFANEYDIQDERGRAVKGCTINYYFFGQNGDMLSLREGREGSLGYQRAKCSIDYAKRSQINRVPAIYDGVFEMAVGSDGKPVMKCVDLHYVQDVAFNTIPVKEK